MSQNSSKQHLACAAILFMSLTSSTYAGTGLMNRLRSSMKEMSKTVDMGLQRTVEALPPPPPAEVAALCPTEPSSLQRYVGNKNMFVHEDRFTALPSILEGFTKPSDWNQDGTYYLSPFNRDLWREEKHFYAYGEIYEVKNKIWTKKGRYVVGSASDWTAESWQNNGQLPAVHFRDHCYVMLKTSDEAPRGADGMVYFGIQMQRFRIKCPSGYSIVEKIGAKDVCRLNSLVQP